MYRYTYIQPLRAFRRARLMGCPAWVLGKSSGIWAMLSLPLNQLGLPWRLGDHFGVLGGSEGSSGGPKGTENAPQVSRRVP